MANNVYTTISIESSEKVIKEFVSKLFTPDVEDADWHQKSNILADNLYSLLYSDYPKDHLTREWMIDNIGAKWCFVHDWQVDNEIIDLTFDSAWYPPVDLFHRLAEYFTEFGEFEIEATSEDEAYCHVSGGYANQVGSEFFVEDDDIPEWPSEDDFDCTEAHDEALENFYDRISEIKENLVIECKEELILYP